MLTQGEKYGNLSELPSFHSTALPLKAYLSDSRLSLPFSLLRKNIHKVKEEKKRGGIQSYRTEEVFLRATGHERQKKALLFLYSSPPPLHGGVGPMHKILVDFRGWPEEGRRGGIRKSPILSPFWCPLPTPTSVLGIRKGGGGGFSPLA